MKKKLAFLVVVTCISGMLFGGLELLRGNEAEAGSTVPACYVFSTDAGINVVQLNNCLAALRTGINSFTTGWTVSGVVRITGGGLVISSVANSLSANTAGIVFASGDTGNYYSIATLNNNLAINDSMDGGGMVQVEHTMSSKNLNYNSGLMAIDIGLDGSYGSETTITPTAGRYFDFPGIYAFVSLVKPAQDGGGIDEVVTTKITTYYQNGYSTTENTMDTLAQLNGAVAYQDQFVSTDNNMTATRLPTWANAMQTDIGDFRVTKYVVSAKTNFPVSSARLGFYMLAKMY
jgi:hypothetical protein